VDDPTVSSLHLAWDSSSGATGYKVYRDTSSSGSFSTVNEVGNVSAWTDTNLSSGTTYYYRVSAYNTFGESSRTDPPAAGTTLVPGSSPPTPTGLQAGSPTLSSLHLSWNSSSGATGYKVLSDTSSSGPFSAVDDVGNATGWTDMGLSSGTTYYYKVTAYNSFGQSPPTGAVQGTTGSLPAVPTGLSATNPTLSTIDLAWDAASDATGHKLFRDTSSTGPFDRVIDVGNATSWTYDGLTSGITYYFKASSYNSFGESAKSTAVWATTGNIPSTPTGLHSDNATLTSVDLEWSTSVGATGYRLYRDAAINGSYATQHDVGSATAYTDMGLSSGTIYYYKVSAYNEFGESPLSSAVTGSACRNYYRDQDGDGYGIDDVICSATPTGPYTALQSGDCDDGAASVYPGAVEICDTKDNDCDGQVDEAGASGCVTYYLDVDGDTYGVTADSKCLCAPEGFYSASTGGDCIDSNSAVHPGASEVCDGLDNDCNGRTDSADSGLVLTLCELQLGVCAGKKHSASQCRGQLAFMAGELCVTTERALRYAGQ
jgi:fibronectin type 3 domain-containing protein